MSFSFRHSAAFGKRIEYYIVGLMLKEGLDVYLPMVDDDAIDAVVKKPDRSFVEVQIKARSKAVAFGGAALFAALTHEYRPNYWFVFYSERMDKTWILSSKEFIKEANQNKRGKKTLLMSVSSFEAARLSRDLLSGMAASITSKRLPTTGQRSAVQTCCIFIRFPMGITCTRFI